MFSLLIASALASTYIRTGIPAILVMLTMIAQVSVRSKHNLKITVWACIALSLIYTLAEFTYTREYFVFSNSLFYFGFLLPLVCVIKRRYSFEKLFLSKNIVIYFCVIIVLEALLVNILPINVINLVPVESEQTKFFDFYQRPMGLAGNATMTACVLYMLWAVRQDLNIEQKREYFYVFAATLALASGLGIILFFTKVIVDLIYKSPRKYNSAVVLAILILLLWLLYTLINNLDLINNIEPGVEGGFNKVSVYYLYNLLELKQSQLFEYFPAIENILIGQQHLMNISQTSGDFGFYLIINTVGLYGMVVIFLIPIVCAHRVQHFPNSFIFLFLSFLHYPGLLTIVGQFVLAFFYHHLLYFKQQPRDRSRPKCTTV